VELLKEIAIHLAAIRAQMDKGILGPPRLAGCGTLNALSPVLLLRGHVPQPEVSPDLQYEQG